MQDNGLEALRLARENIFGLILMDVHMPLMDGLEAARALRALGNAIAQPRIIALTANAMADDREECFLAGMDDFIAKPFDPDRFLHTVSLNFTTCGPGEVEALAGDAPDRTA
jgi:CheY-like chemotaxis protein